MSDDGHHQISPDQLRWLKAFLASQMPDRMPTAPVDVSGVELDRHLMDGLRRRDGRDIYMFPPHLRKLFDTLSEGDVAKLERLMSLRPETIGWIHDKNDRELKNLDGAVEFITSSRTAGKWLLWIGGLSVTFVGGVTALAKNGIDLFAMLRGGR